MSNLGYRQHDFANWGARGSGQSDRLGGPAALELGPHGDKQVSTKNLARGIGAKSVEPCKPEVAQRHSGYMVGGTSPFGSKKAMPVYVEESVLGLERICINGGRRGYLIGIVPAVLTELLGAKPVNCAL